MVNMAPMTGVPRSLLHSHKNHNLCSGVYGLSRAFGGSSATVSLSFQYGMKSQSYRPRHFSTIKRRFVPGFKDQSGSTRISSNIKRTLASQAGSSEVSEDNADTHSDPTKVAEDQPISLDNQFTIRIGGPYYETPIFVGRHWLRDSCECSICVDPDSGQKNFGTCDVPTELPIEGIPKIEDGVLEVIWENDFLSSGNHISRYPLSMLRKELPDPLPTRTLWDKATFEKDRLSIDYSEWTAGGEGFLSGLLRLHTHGLLFLHNVPSSEESVISIANQIGNLQETFYGRTWDVRSKPKAENIAYTSSFLGLHQDLLYMRDPPRIQILHCLENSCEGGESMFSDGLRASNLIKVGPEQFAYRLCRLPLRYRYNKHGHHYQMHHPVLNLKEDSFFWSPPFQASNGGSFHNMDSNEFYRSWLEAATEFRRLLEDEQWVYQYKLQPGECVIFDNLRVAHGRRKFDAASGNRWLKGAYIANDVFKSKCITMKPQLKALGMGNEFPLREQTNRLNDEYKLWEKRKTKSHLLNVLRGPKLKKKTKMNENQAV
ncbi:hypothetical protein F4776DRAFT_347304 [Hypoxylon sp. NC0597]|nr:hypothetical protein F4776DRAFT_347304 [Hypoxylon sp. NC0597]